MRTGGGRMTKGVLVKLQGRAPAPCQRQPCLQAALPRGGRGWGSKAGGAQEAAEEKRTCCCFSSPSERGSKTCGWGGAARGCGVQKGHAGH